MSNYREHLYKGASGKILGSARILRKQMTGSEQILWEQLRDRKLSGFKIRRQHPIGSYIADFYCHEAKLVIEVDGHVHDSKEQAIYDMNRTKDLDLIDIKVIRFKNEDIEQRLTEVLKTIGKELGA